MTTIRPSYAYLVLGATGAVGTALTHRLAWAGHDVMAAGRKTALLDEFRDKLGCPTTTIEATDPASISRAVERTVEEFGRIDGVANCVGSLFLKPAHTTTDDEWQATLAVNLTSAFAALRAAAKQMHREGGAIVLVSSAAARIGLPNHEATAAAKAGIVGLTLSAAASYANDGIRVNAVAPGLVKSPMTRRLWESESAAETSVEMHALGRLGEPDEVAAAIEWLLDPANSWITGQILGVDGGLAAVVPRKRVS
jgi:NAD(P)-dependent dehydrogenase (short-subunit alcohol dehydrogenase family)